MAWIEKDGHAFQDQETKDAYEKYTKDARLFANIGLGFAGPLALVVFFYTGGIPQVIADVGTHIVPFSVIVAVSIFCVPAPFAGYYGSKATFLHDSDKMRCYVNHSKWRRKKGDDEGPIRGPELPFPTVKI